MIRCKQCGKPLGAGQVLLGDRVACSDCVDENVMGPCEQWGKAVQRQMNESRQEKASGADRRLYRQKRK